MINATIAIAAAPINAQVSGAANTLPTNVFRMKTEVAETTNIKNNNNIISIVFFY